MTTQGCELLQTGWGSGWGNAPWGGGSSLDLELVRADAVADNLVRLTFTQQVLATGLLDLRDATNPDRYSVVPVAGTVGADELAARPVLAIAAELSRAPGTLGFAIDVSLDRAMSPYPARYRASANNLFTVDGFALSPCASSLEYFGVAAPPPAGVSPLSAAGQDFAHPDTLSSALSSPLPNAADPGVLGSIPIGPDGDYAVDSGIANLKKRVVRRLTTAVGGFLHLPGYGVGIPQELKRSARAATISRIVASAEAQIRQEPDVAAVAVSYRAGSSPGLHLFTVVVRPTWGQAVSFDVRLSA